MCGRIEQAHEERKRIEKPPAQEKARKEIPPEQDEKEADPSGRLFLRLDKVHAFHVNSEQELKDCVADTKELAAGALADLRERLVRGICDGEANVRDRLQKLQSLAHLELPPDALADGMEHVYATLHELAALPPSHDTAMTLGAIQALPDATFTAPGVHDAVVQRLGSATVEALRHAPSTLAQCMRAFLVHLFIVKGGAPHAAAVNSLQERMRKDVLAAVGAALAPLPSNKGWSLVHKTMSTKSAIPDAPAPPESDERAAHWLGAVRELLTSGNAFLRALARKLARTVEPERGEHLMLALLVGEPGLDAGAAGTESGQAMTEARSEILRELPLDASEAAAKALVSALASGDAELRQVVASWVGSGCRSSRCCCSCGSIPASVSKCLPPTLGERQASG